MLTYTQVFGTVPNTTLVLLEDALLGGYNLTERGNPIATVNALLECLKQNYALTFPDGADNFIVSQKRQNISVDEQRITYTIVVDRQIELGSPFEPVVITPEA